MTSKLTPFLIAAIIIGALIGFYLPDLTANNSNNTIPTNNSRIVGDITGYATITDGDTIKINGERIRFHGIDAPELNQPCWTNGQQYQCGQNAKSQLVSIVNNGIVTCVTESTDRYGRKIARCYNSQNEDIEALMVSSGWATAYTYYSKDYVAEEEHARQNKLGVWAGEFEDPYEFRRNNRR